MVNSNPLVGVPGRTVAPNTFSIHLNAFMDMVVKTMKTEYYFFPNYFCFLIQSSFLLFVSETAVLLFKQPP